MPTTCTTFEDDANTVWIAFKNTTNNLGLTKAQWDTAWDRYNDDMEDLRIAHGRPSGKPKGRPL